MKIKFIKQFRCIDIVKDGIDVLIEAGQTAEFDRSESAKWLIDNGFAEEVKQPSWEKPTRGDNYYFIESDGETTWTAWANFPIDESRHSMGNCFSTKGAAERYRDYLKAVATVRQDEGVLTTGEAYRQCANGNRVYCLMPPGTVRNSISVVAPGGIYYKDTESARASWDAHHKEWQTIMNYDWSRE